MLKLDPNRPVLIYLILGAAILCLSYQWQAVYQELFGLDPQEINNSWENSRISLFSFLVLARLVFGSISVYGLFKGKKWGWVGTLAATFLPEAVVPPVIDWMFSSQRAGLVWDLRLRGWIFIHGVAAIALFSRGVVNFCKFNKLSLIMSTLVSLVTSLAITAAISNQYYYALGEVFGILVSNNPN